MELAIGFGSLAALVIANLVMVAFNYGKLAQRMTDLCDRVSRLENAVFDGRK